MNNIYAETAAHKYMHAVSNAIGDKLINPDGIYYGREGHLRLARECGYALNDFQGKDRSDILHSSYSVIYVKGCNLKPLLSAKEWAEEMLKGVSN